MRPFLSGSPLRVLLVVFLSACVPPSLGEDADLEPPRVVWLSVGDPVSGSPPTVAPPDQVEVRFSEPLDPFTVTEDTVLLVEGTALGPCQGAEGCLEGLCVEGTCVTPPADAAFREDANSPPVAASRRARVVPGRVSLTADALEVRLTPARPLGPAQRYALVLSAALRDRAGNPLASPDGRELGVVREFLTGAPGGPRPRVFLLVPEAGAVGVAPNLPEVRVGVTAPVSGLEGQGVWLEGPSGPVPAVASRIPDGCPAELHGCYRLSLAAPLAPATAYRLLWDPALADAEGRPVPGSGEPGFVTGTEPDAAPPRVDGLGWEPEGGCLAVRFTTDEPARARVRVTAAGGVLEQGPGGIGTEHLALLPLPDGEATLEVETWDAVGNRGLHGPIALTVPPLAAVAISEVLANPAGSEPAQELVEIVNLGPTPVALEGWRLTDDLAKEGDALPVVVLAPGAIGLVVTASYDSGDPADPAPAPGAVLLPIAGTTLGSAGLSNGGEPVWLLDAEGGVVSYFPGTAEGGALPADGQSVVRDVGAGCAARGPWRLQPEGTSTPGWLE